LRSRYAGSELLGIYAVMSVASGIGALLGPFLTGLAMEVTRHGLAIFAALVCATFATLAWRKRASE